MSLLNLPEDIIEFIGIDCGQFNLLAVNKLTFNIFKKYCETYNFDVLLDKEFDTTDVNDIIFSDEKYENIMRNINLLQRCSIGVMKIIIIMWKKMCWKKISSKN